MKTTSALVFYSLFSGVGLLLGNFVFVEYLKVETIEQHLKKTGNTTLDTVGNKNDNEWLVLAQQYREHGAVLEKRVRDFSKQTNPRFISYQDWIKYAKHSLKDKTIHDFSKDEELAKILKSTCNAALNKSYDSELFSKVRRWCDIQLTDVVRNLLRFQKNSGNCRFWLVDPSDSKQGWFVWEDFGKDSLFPWHLYRNFVSENSSWQHLIKHKNKFVAKCKASPNQIVKLLYQRVPLRAFKKPVNTWTESESQ